MVLYLPSDNLLLLFNASSPLELSGLVHEDEPRQGSSREDKFLCVHINLLIENKLIIIYHYQHWAYCVKFKFIA